MVRKHYLEGLQIGNFLVGEYENKYFSCICKCGKKIKITGYELKRGAVKSCGCEIDHNSPHYEKKFREKFWSKVNKKENNCFEWTASNRNGYGTVNYKGKKYVCSRLIWIWENGEIPKGMIICHKCDNPSCVNIEHLFLGNKRDNMQDCLKKNRKNPLFGEKNPQAKLKGSQVKEIKYMLQLKLSRRIIADKFGIGITTVGHIKQGHNWKHVTI